MSGVTVISQTQRIVVNPSTSSVSVINAGPMGPTGVTGPSEAAAVLDDGELLTKVTGALAPITRANLADDISFSSRYSTFINHGSTAATARTGTAPTFWIGSVNPTNATNNDALYRTDTTALYIRVAGAWVEVGSNRYSVPGVWTANTPTISGTGWALGNGTITGRYRNNDKTVRYRGTINAGSTTTFGSAQLFISLPPSLNASAATPRCTGQVFIISNNVYAGVCSIVASASTMAMFGQSSSVGQLTSLVQNAPVALVNGSSIGWDIEYEAS